MESDNVSSGFDSAGPFSGGASDGLRAAIDAVNQVMNRGNHSDMPTEVNQDIVDATAQDILQNAKTIEDKNKIVKTHFDKMGVKGEVTSQNVAAFEKAVMNRLGK
tara:strand:- start:524 stop:838 length:315 start_codon:yes stop_codon:yes gene_type:complete